MNKDTLLTKVGFVTTYIILGITKDNPFIIL